MARSPLVYLHPDGDVDGLLAPGAGAAALRTPVSGSGRSAGIAVLIPSRGNARDRSWLAEAREIAAAVDADGLVVVPRRARRLRARLAADGWQAGEMFTCVPSLEAVRYAVPARRATLAYGLGGLIPLSPLKRWAAAVLVRLGATAVSANAVVLRRPGARPLFEWLHRYEPSSRACTAIVAAGWRREGSIVIHRFGSGARPDAIVKVGAATEAEAEVLATLAKGAGAAAGAFPRVVGRDRIGGVPAIIEAPLDGIPALAALAGSPAQARSLMRAVATWLKTWNAETIDWRPLEPADADRDLLAPAARLQDSIGVGMAFSAHLQGLAAACVSRRVPVVAAHNDLTAANMLIDNERLGVVDWEESTLRGLPLADLIYALADIAAAVDRYRSREAGFAACFERGGAYAEIAGELVREVTAMLDIVPVYASYCVHATWLRHANNERQARESGAELPFLEIVRRLATSATSAPESRVKR